MFKYRLYTVDGDELGTRSFAVSHWSIGDVVALGDVIYRVYDIVDVEENDAGISGLLMLERPRADPA